VPSILGNASRWRETKNTEGPPTLPELTFAARRKLKSPKIRAQNTNQETTGSGEERDQAKGKQLEIENLDTLCN